MEIEHLKRRIAELEQENAELRRRLSPNDNGMRQTAIDGSSNCTQSVSYCESDHGLTQEHVQRYSRHLVLNRFGVYAQKRLCDGSVLVVGAGGLGSSALMYLAGAGIGRIGIVDKDTVALNNLHRQVIHTEASVGWEKTESAKAFCLALNSSINVEIFSEGLTPTNAIDMIDLYDVVIDASDNAATRYLISDACVVAGKPLVSGAAIGMDGQLTVYNYGKDGPCYRCLFPKAPPIGACSKCSEAGVLGPVPGAVGVLQALEAIKIISKVGTPLSQQMLIMDLFEADFRSVKLRGKNPDCIACGRNATITRSTLSAYDYVQFTGQLFLEDQALLSQDEQSPTNRLYPSQLAQILDQNGHKPALIIDVRPRSEYDICHIKDSHCYPLSSLSHNIQSIRELCLEAESSRRAIVVVCRRGNDSQLAVDELSRCGLFGVKDLIGGLQAWREQIDKTFLNY